MPFSGPYEVIDQTGNDVKCRHLATHAVGGETFKGSFIEVLSALLQGEAQIVGGISDLAYYRAALPGFRLSS